MANEGELKVAKLWCDEARMLLKVAKYSKDGQKNISQRIDKIFSELNALDKGVQSGKYALAPEMLQDYVQRFLAMAAALNTAARKQDLVEVDRQSSRLSELKKELAVELATSKRSKDKAQGKLDARALGNAEMNSYVEARDAAISRISDLRVHEQADAIETDLDLIETSRLDIAKSLADNHDYAGAMNLLAGVEGACVLAEGFANRCAAYAVDLSKIRPRLVLCRQHKQAVAADAELRHADERVRAAEGFAVIMTRDYNGAISALGEAWDLSVEALKIAERCVAFVDARPTAVKAVIDLSKHSQVDAVQPEVDDLKQKLLRADTLAEVATRKYEEAIVLLGEIKSEAPLAVTLADQCQAYLDEKVRVEDAIVDCGRHAQADAVEAELHRAAEQLAEAAAMALPTVRNFAAALIILGDAWASGEEAKRIADLCQKAVDARRPGAELLSALGTQRKRFDSVRLALETLEPSLLQADALAAKDKRQYESAKKAYEQIAVDAGLVKAEADKEMWDQSQEHVAKIVLEGLQADSPERTRLEAMWALAHEQAENGEHGKALQTLAKVRELALEALKTQPLAPIGKSVTERSAELDTDIKTSVALSAAQDFVNKELKAAIALGTEFGDKAPATWKVETDRIALTLTLERDAGLVAIETALAQAG